MRTSRVVLGALAIAIASCRPINSKIPLGLEDGCYYVGAKPVFKIAGTEGRVLIPGEVKAFKVKRGRFLFRAWATFSPAFAFDGFDENGNPRPVQAYADREPFTFYMKAETDGPTIQMFEGGYGFQDVTLGEHC